MIELDPSRSRRYDVPPLWLVPILLIVGIVTVVYVRRRTADRE